MHFGQADHTLRSHNTYSRSPPDKWRFQPHSLRFRHIEYLLAFTQSLFLFSQLEFCPLTYLMPCLHVQYYLKIILKLFQCFISHVTIIQKRKEHGYLIYGAVVHRRGTGDWAICHHRLHTGGRGVCVMVIVRVTHSTVGVCHRARFSALPQKGRKEERLEQCGFKKRRCGTVEIVKQDHGRST